MTEKLDPITTALGDTGETDLADGSRVAKTHPLIVAAGEVEALMTEVGRVLADTEPQPAHRGWLERIAHELLDLSCDLAAPPSLEDGRPRIDAGYVEWVEKACAETGQSLESLDTFVAIFPTPAAAGVNVCRTTCRRAELAVFAVEDANPQIGRYLNRLSDLLFLVARAEAGGGEVRWRPGRSVVRT
jgi:cob(I)alamin adenosyltransferase